MSDNKSKNKYNENTSKKPSNIEDKQKIKIEGNNTKVSKEEKK